MLSPRASISDAKHLGSTVYHAKHVCEAQTTLLRNHAILGPTTGGDKCSVVFEGGLLINDWCLAFVLSPVAGGLGVKPVLILSGTNKEGCG